MKISFLFSDFMPLLKCGEAIAAVTSVLSGTYNAKQSAMNVHSQLSAQSHENAINRDWQTELAELARQYNTEERLAAQSWNEAMMDKQNVYSSPVEQSKRYQAAGLNPVIAQAGSGLNSVSSQPASSAGQTSPIPSGISGLSPVSFHPSSIDVAHLMNGVGSMMKNFAEAKNLGVNTDILSQSAEYLINSNMLDAQQKEIVNGMLRIDKEIKENTKDPVISRIWDESRQAMFHALISADEQSRQQNITRLIESQESLNNALAEYHGKNKELLGLDIANYDTKLNAYIKLTGAQANAANASATESRASAGLKYSQTDAQELANSLERGVFDSKLKTMLSDYKKQDKQNSADYQKAIDMLTKYERLNKNNDNAAASYLNYTLWFIKEHCPNLPVVPFLNLGK